MKSNFISIDDFKKQLVDRINSVIKDESYSSISKYIAALPKNDSTDDELLYWGLAPINKYYKDTFKLSVKKIEEEPEIWKNYTTYLRNTYGDIVFTVEEFVTFSKILSTVFSDYNPNKIRNIDKSSYHCGIEQIDELFKTFVYVIYHTENDHAYEISRTRLSILKQTLLEKQKDLITTELIDINKKDNI